MIHAWLPAVVWIEVLLKIFSGDFSGAGQELNNCSTADCARARLLLAFAELAASRPERAAAEFAAARRLTPPESVLAGKASFGLAECMAFQKKFEKAEAIFSSALDNLLGEKRRGQVASRLMRLAEEKLSPPIGVEAQPAAAELFLRAALELDPDAQLQDKLRLLIGHSLARQKRHAEAAEHFRQAAELCAKAACKHESLWQAARQYLLATDPKTARRMINDLLDAAPPRLLEEKARRLLAKSYALSSAKNALDLFDGLKAWQELLLRFPESPRTERIRLEMGLSLLRAGHLSRAADNLSAFIEKGATEELLAEARFFLGECLFKQELYQQAIDVWQQYVSRHSAGRRWLAARDGIEQAAWMMAEAAAGEKNWQQALKNYQAFVAAWPGSARTASALLKAAQAARELDNRALAIKLLEELAARFPQSAEACRGWYELGRLSEEREDFATARRHYQKAASCPKGAVAEASASLKILDQPWLEVEPVAVFRTNQHAEITVHSRNLKEITLSLYRIQAEDFFRDRRDMEKLTELDVGLCRADRTLAVTVEGARPHARLKQKVRLPVSDPGLYLLRLSAADLEATTAVRISNLELILKTSASQAFVFAEDALQAQPRPGVKVLVADGGAILGEGRTDRRGSFSLNLPYRPENLRVLALDGAHPAFAYSDSMPESPQQDPIARAVVFPERPAFRPGESVRIAGMVRNLNTPAGLPAFAAGDKLELTVASPDGLTLLKQPVVMDDYGIFDAVLTLDANAPEGRYSMSLADSSGVIASGFFTVQIFSPPPFEVSVISDRVALRRGEPFTGSISLRHFGAAAAADLSVNYRLGNTGAWTTARSDRDGLVRFSLPTRDLPEYGKLKFVVRVAAVNLEKELDILVAERQFKIEISTGRARLIAGQPFDLQLKVSALDGSPRRAEVALEIIRRTEAGERRVMGKNVSIGESGEARLGVSVERGGSYFARALATDPDGWPVFKEIYFRVEPAERPALTMDVEQTVLPPGQPVAVRLEASFSPALVLLCAETDQVLECLTTRMQDSRTQIAFPAPSEAAGRFLLTATTLEGKKVHCSVREIVIDRGIELQIRTDRREYRPGQQVTLTLTARDRQGRPLDVGVVLAVVDEALFQIFPENVADLHQVFVPRRELAQPAVFASNEFEFPAVEAAPVSAPEVAETEGSAVMAALATKRKDITARAAADFGKMSGAGTIGILGATGTGAEGGGSATAAAQAARPCVWERPNPWEEGP